MGMPRFQQFPGRLRGNLRVAEDGNAGYVQKSGLCDSGSSGLHPQVVAGLADHRSLGDHVNRQGVIPSRNHATHIVGTHPMLTVFQKHDLVGQTDSHQGTAGAFGAVLQRRGYRTARSHVASATEQLQRPLHQRIVEGNRNPPL